MTAIIAARNRENEARNRYRSLYNDIQGYYQSHLDFIDPIYYNIVTGYTLLSYRIEDIQELPYLAFVGVSGSGKTRALEAMSKVCYNPRLVVRVTQSALYRELSGNDVTFLCDEFESNQRTPDLITVLNGGYRRGQSVLVNIPDREQGWIPRQFEVFGPKAIASIEPPSGAFRNRCICIPMVRNNSEINHRIDEEIAENLCTRLEQYKEESSGSVQDQWNELSEAGITHRRLMELYNVILSLTPADYREELIEFIQYEQRQILSSEQTSPFAIVFRALDRVLEGSTSNRVLIRDVADNFNSDEAWLDYDVTNRQIGVWLTSMGYTERFRLGPGIGCTIDSRVHERNRQRYQRE